MNFLNEITRKRLKFLPENKFIITKTEEFTFSEIESEVFACATALKKIGISENECVSILSSNNKDFIILVLALWMIDAIPVPLNTRSTENEIEKLLSISGSEKILVHKDFANNFKNISAKEIIFPLKHTDNVENYLNSADLVKTAVVIFTSGSTGIPKGVELSFNNLIKNAEIGNTLLQQDHKSRWLASLPFYHIGGFSIITRVLTLGGSIIIPSSLSTDDLKFCFEKQNPSHASLVGTQMDRLLESNTQPPANLTNVLLGGGFIDNELIKKSVNNGWKVSKVYGSSETTSFVTGISGEKLIEKIDSSGKALQPNEIKIIDNKNNYLPTGRSGEIIVKSETVMKGYLNNPDETNKKLKNEFYHTGDFGYLDSEGYLFVEARRTDLIVSGGENINPREVEKEIMNHTEVTDCCVIGIEDKTWGQIVVAAVSVNSESISAESLKTFLKKKLAGHKIPKKIIFVEDIPKTELGKTEKAKVKELFN